MLRNSFRVEGKTHVDLIHQVTNLVAITNLRNSVNFCFQVGPRNHVVQVKGFVSIELNWIGAAFGSGPEGLTSRCLLIAREVEQQLFDLVAEILFEMQASPFNAIGDSCWTIINQGALTEKETVMKSI